MKQLLLIIFFLPLFIFAQTDKQWIEKGKRDLCDITFDTIIKEWRLGHDIIPLLKDYEPQKQNKEKLARFSTIMELILNELKPYKKELNEIYGSDISSKEIYLKIFSLYLDKTITE